MKSGNSWSQAFAWVWLPMLYGGAQMGFFPLGVKIQFTTRIRYTPSQTINKFPVTEAQPHQTELCAALKRKRIKNCYSLTQAGWTRCVPDFWFEFSRLLSSQNKQILLPQAYGSNTCNLHPIWDLFQAMSDYKMSQEVTLDPHYWVQTLSIPFCSTVQERCFYYNFYLCCISTCKLESTATPLPSCCEKWKM